MDKRNAVHEASRRSKAQGLDHSDTLEAEKRHAWWTELASECIGRVVSARSAYLNGQDKPHVRAIERPVGWQCCSPAAKQESSRIKILIFLT